jgi:hypothetical protein
MVKEGAMDGDVRIEDFNDKASVLCAGYTNGIHARPKDGFRDRKKSAGAFQKGAS